ncbi:MAG TPA: hypothetical protein VH164_00940 [Ktedonobacteraceae bacterium]|nr:hypothetical protein [Ktedonobacteraceae bacterium]
MTRKTNVVYGGWLPGSLLPLLLLLLFGLTGCTTGLFGGTVWEAGSLQNQHLQVITADPNNLHAVYAGDARDGVFASPDTGASWKRSDVGLPHPVAVDALAFDIPGKKLFAGTSAGLFISSDSASHWSQAAHTPADTYTSLAFDVNAPQVVYAATAHSGALESTDDGATWQSINHGLPTGALTSILYDPNLKQLWAAFDDALYRSDDHGASWHPMSNGLPANVGINVLSLGSQASNNGSLVFAGTNHGFFRSTDAGQHWAQSQYKLINLHIQDVLPDATQTNTVYASTNIGVLKSTDNGQNWSEAASGLPSGQPFGGLAQAGDNYSQLFVASHGIYLYPGSQSFVDPSRLFPILLILIFFILLLYFGVIRRRRAALLHFPANTNGAKGQGTPPTRHAREKSPGSGADE